MEVKISNRNKVIFKAELPGSWEELSERQFRKIYTFLYASPGKPDYIKNRLKVLFILLLSNSRNPIKKLKILFSALFKLDALQVYDLCQVIKFLFDTFPSRAFIKSFTHRGTRYYLPDDNLQNISMIEYIFADNFLSFVPYDTTNGSLDKLVATLCRPESWLWTIRRRLPAFNNGDRRQKFNTNLLEPRARSLKRLSLHKKLMVLYFFVGSKLQIIKKYRAIFPPPKEDEIGGEGGDWLELLNDVAQTRIYGDYDKTAYYNLHTVLHNLNREQQKKNALKK